MIWLCFFILVGTIVASLASLRSKRGDALGIPLVAIGSFTFLYVIQPLRILLSGTLEALLTDGQAEKALLVPAAMLSCFMWGWIRTRSHHAEMHVDGPGWVGRSMWNAGFLTATVGLGLDIIFLQRSGGVLYSFSKEHGTAMAWEQNSAYLYNGIWWVLVGGIMMVYGVVGSKQPRWKTYVPYMFLTTVLLHAIFTGSRGPLFSVISSYLVARCLAQRRAPSLASALGALGVLGFGVLMMVGFRNVLHLGSHETNELRTFGSALDKSIGVNAKDEAHGIIAQEFLFHATALEAVDVSGKLDYGLTWVYFLAINPIPRQWWPDKHYPDTPGITVEDMEDATSLRIASGSAWGIVADIYTRFGVMSIGFFYLLGRLSRRLFDAARRLDSPLASCGYVLLYATSLNLFTQGFGAVFVTIGYSMVPVVLFSLFSRRGRRRVDPLRQVAIGGSEAVHPGTQCS